MNSLLYNALATGCARLAQRARMKAINSASHPENDTASRSFSALAVVNMLARRL
jgi:hypothetical protein